MLVSVVIKTRAEAPRLRLVLASLERQKIAIVGDGELPPRDSVTAEIVVVNDGADAATAAVLDETPLPVQTLDLNPARGRSAASNAGASIARGEWLLFLDGDTLAGPGLIARHVAVQREVPGFLRGETYHLRCTRFFADPETGLPWPGCEEQAKRVQRDLARHLVTREQVLERFEEIEARSQPGIYPGAGPRRLFELEWDALQNHPDLDVLWMAASGHNASVRRADFNAVGGFDERLTINEHRELALRLQATGVRVRPVAAARSYHLTHRLGWRDPLVDREWERKVYSAHPCPLSFGKAWPGMRPFP